MNPFIQKLVEDLKSFSADLLLPGLHSTQQNSGDMGTVASSAALLKAIDLLTALIPKLVSELQTTDTTRKVMLHYTTLPKRATFSRRPSDYQLDTQKRLLPSHWLTVLPVPEIDTRPLRWLFYLLELQQEALSKVRNRISKYVENSLISQQGSSSYAQSDRSTLLNMRNRLDEAQSKLEHAFIMLRRSVPIRFTPSPNVPTPYPRSPAWIRLRQYAQQLIDPIEYLPSFLHTLLYGTVEIADTPYLYQRWCGVKMLMGLEKLGWRVQNDPVGALFLGGEVCLRKSNVKISLWVEPRFSKRKMHPSGFACPNVSEVHPDYLIVTPGPKGVDAFILDPTTTNDVEIRRSKGKYLNTIEAVGMTLIAGIPVVRNPLRAWSAAPLHTPYCELEDSEGRVGTIPMHPLDWSAHPLQEWLQDIDNYALAWGHFDASLSSKNESALVS